MKWLCNICIGFIVAASLAGCQQLPVTNNLSQLNSFDSVDLASEPHAAIFEMIHASIRVHTARVGDDDISFLDGGTFGFALWFGERKRYVIFPHPRRWTKTQALSKKPIVLWNTSPDVDGAIDITHDTELLKIIEFTLCQPPPSRYTWRHECARVALSGQMIWTQMGLMVVPESARHFVSRTTRKQANSQPLLNVRDPAKD